jgi:hypothetical protein
MTYDDDPDLERRLRRIAQPPEPPVPGSVFRYANEVTIRRRGSQMGPSSNWLPRRGLVIGLASAAAVLALVVGITAILVSSNNGNVAGGPTPRPTGSTTVGPSATPQITLPSQTFSVGPLPADFVTEGSDATEAWTRVSFGAAPTAMNEWAKMPQRWNGGWMAWQTPADVVNPVITWLSADGHNWHATVAPGQPFASATGLVAYSEDRAWTSPDGIVWTSHDVVGTMPVQCHSCVGGPAGIAASLDDGTVIYSHDGVSWAPVTLAGLPEGTKGTSLEWSGSRFVAVVSVTSVSNEVQTLSYVSPNGAVWTGRPLSGLFAGRAVSEVVADEGAILIHFANPNGSTDLWARSADGGSWQEATEVEALKSSDVFDTTIASNGDRFLATLTSKSLDWTMQTSTDGVTWTPLGGRSATPGVLFPRLMPHGIYLAYQWACADTQSGGWCTTMPPSGPQYGPAQ